MLVETQEQFDKEVAWISKFTQLVVDVETNGLDAFGFNQLCGVGI